MDFLHPTSPPESTKKQSILQKALEIERKLKIAENDENNNEMSENCVSFRFFVGHLQAVHTEDVLMKFFSKFGHVVNVSIPLSSDKKPRGFAYVSFSELNYKNPLKIGNHLIAGKKVYVDISEPSKHHKDITKTLLVSGIIQDISHSSLKSYFEQFGKISEVIRHRESRRRYFHWAFVHFESEESSRKALEQKQHKINGNIVDIRCAQDFKPEKRGNVQEKNSLNVKKLLISNLNPKTNSSSLRSYFEKFGQVYDAYIPTFYGRNESKCYGYIVVNKDVPLEYENHTIDGNEVAIEIDNPARFKEQVKTLLVSASPETLEKITENSLRETFKKFGNIVSIRKPNDPKSKKSAHYAFVEYTSPNAVEEAISKLNNNKKKNS
jgi:RNA recognition motif-containing protein